MSNFFTVFNSNVLNTLMTAGAFGLVYSVIVQLLKKHLTDERVFEKIRARIFYSLMGLFLFLLTKIWVDGFTHVITLLSVVSAALVIANKELIMSLVGWLIINWRELFTERDFIHINEYTGYVYEIGLLYFKILQISPNDIKRTSGKVIKVPNSLVIMNPLVNYSDKSNMIEYTLSWRLTFDSDHQQFKSLIYTISSDELSKLYKNNHKYSMEWQRKRDTFITAHLSLGAQVKTNVIQNQSPYGIEVSVYFFSFLLDSTMLKNNIQTRVLNLFDQHPEFKLSH